MQGNYQVCCHRDPFGETIYWKLTGIKWWSGPLSVVNTGKKGTQITFF